MASPSKLNIDPLLAPISEASPCGEDLPKWHPILKEIDKARDERDNRQADWKLVLGQSRDALAQRSKHLGLASYCTEALVRLHGFAGLRDGVRLLNGLLTTYWRDLYPSPAGDNLSGRAGWITRLTAADSGTYLPNHLRNLSLISLDAADRHSWLFWSSCTAAPQGAQEKDEDFQKRQQAAELRNKEWQEAVKSAAPDDLVTLREDIGECVGEVNTLKELLRKSFDEETAPGTSALSEALEDCYGFVTKILKDKGLLKDERRDGGVDEPKPMTDDRPRPPMSGPVQSRDDALRRLTEVAAFFEATEPHSPVSYLVKRAATWGKMPLDELFAELIKDQAARDQISDLLGFKRRARE